MAKNKKRPLLSKERYRCPKCGLSVRRFESGIFEAHWPLGKKKRCDGKSHGTAALKNPPAGSRRN